MKKLNHLLSFVLILFIAACEPETDAPKGSLLVLDGWKISSSPLGFDINPSDLFFVNEAMGFVVGLNGQIYKTTDAGKSWQKQDAGTTLHLLSVFFLSEKTGFVGGQSMNCLSPDCGKGSVFLKTSDGGNTWTKIFLPEYYQINSLHFFDEQNGLALMHGPNGPNSKNQFMARTADGGLTWSAVDLAIQPDQKVFYVDHTAFVMGDTQNIFKSTDQGHTWKEINTPVPASNNIRKIYFYNESTGFLDGVTHFYKTTNGGLSWQVMAAPFQTMGLFHFYDDKEGFNIESFYAYTGGDFPTFQGLKCSQTKNAGLTWQTTNSTDFLNPWIHFFPRRDLGYGLGRTEFYTFKKR